MKISIVIPVFNEQENISNLLDCLLQMKNTEFTTEIIVVDGGSQDKTLEILKSYSEIKILQSEKSRAKQMNFGAKNATCDVLYFLHCDTFPPINFDLEILKQIQKGNFSGCFKMKFDNNHIVLRISQWFTQFNFQAFRGGDQSLFVQKQLFERLNGFNESLIIYEDNELIYRLYQNSKFTVIQRTVTTSARKYLKNGILSLQFHFFMIHCKYWLGHSQENLVRYYQQNIK